MHVTGELPARVQEALAESFALVDAVEGADGILSVLTTPVDGELLDRAGQQLRIVANYGVGVDNVDLEAARARDVLIANTPDVLTDAVAELTIALTLALLRRVAEGDRFLRRQSRWSFSLDFMLGRSLRGKTFGVVGAGRIGRAAASLAAALGARPVFAGRSDDDLDGLLRDLRRRESPLPADARDTAPDRRCGTRADAADVGSRQHRARADCR